MHCKKEIVDMKYVITINFKMNYYFPFVQSFFFFFNTILAFCYVAKVTSHLIIRKMHLKLYIVLIYMCVYFAILWYYFYNIGGLNQSTSLLAVYTCCIYYLQNNNHV